MKAISPMRQFDPRQCLGVAGPDGLGFAWSTHQGTAAAQHPVEAAQTTGDAVGLAQSGVETAYTDAKVT